MTQARTLNLDKILAILTFLAILFSIVYLIFLPNTFAETSTQSSKIQEIKEKFKERQDAKKEARLAKLDAKKLKACQTKEKVLTNRQGSLTKMTENMLEKFDKIATRVKYFYTNKVVPGGKTVSNYDDLVADVDAKKEAAQTALSAAKANTDSFSCDSDDPKGALNKFREDMQAVKGALKDYRTAIKDLIVAVKSVASEGNPSPSPTPAP